MIKVDYASNGIILKGIKQWKKEFRNMLKSA